MSQKWDGELREGSCTIYISGSMYHADTASYKYLSTATPSVNGPVLSSVLDINIDLVLYPHRPYHVTSPIEVISNYM